MRRFLVLVFVLAFVCINLSIAFAEETHPFSVHDMLAMDRISDPQVSPDGKWIVFTLRKTDLDANRGRTDLWLVDVEGKNLRQLTSHPAGDFNPRWSSCGKYIWFLSTRSGSSQVWGISLNGGEAQQITKLPLDVGNLLVSPYSKYIAFTMEIFVDLKSVQKTKEKLDAIAAQKTTGKIYDRLFIRHWDTWLDGRRSHLFVMPINGGDPVDVMPGMDADAPSKPFGGPEEIAFTPDGKGIVLAARDVGTEEAWSTDFDLYYAPLDGSQPPKCLTEQNEAWDTQPAFSPDGKTLAYLAMSKPRYEADRYRIILHNWSDGTKQVLTENWDRSPSSISWSADSKTIFATAENIGQSSLFAIDVKTGIAKTIVKDGTIGSPGVAGKRIVYAMDNLKSPVELFSVNPDGSDPKAITQINADKLAKTRMGDYEQFSFKGWNDATVYCYIVKPIDFDPAKKYPIAFLIHGGPQGSFGNHFHYR
ncbi:MAG TPA: hypothetical protein VGD14_10935 [bacterium]